MVSVFEEKLQIISIPSAFQYFFSSPLIGFSKQSIEAFFHIKSLS